MHDPNVVAFELGPITIWHHDPQTDGTDDSCGWFIRPRHGNKEMLKTIIKAFDFDWDRVFKSDSGKVYYCGLFTPEGYPNMSLHAITLNLFQLAAFKMFGRKKANKFIQNNIADILFFAENPCDSLNTSLNQTFGKEKREDRIKSFAGIIYSYILRQTRSWYKHPKYHIWHWKIQIPIVQRIKRYLFSKCSRCGKGFKYRESPVSGSWNSDGPKWFKSEKNIYHSDCSIAQIDKQQIKAIQYE